MKTIKLITVTAILLSTGCGKEKSEKVPVVSPDNPSILLVDWCIRLHTGYLITDLSRGYILECIRQNNQ